MKGKGWLWGGQIEDYIRESEGHAKGATTSRALRMLAQENRVERTEELFNGRWCVKYRHVCQPGKCYDAMKTGTQETFHKSLKN